MSDAILLFVRCYGVINQGQPNNARSTDVLTSQVLLELHVQPRSLFPNLNIAIHLSACDSLDFQ